MGKNRTISRFIRGQAINGEEDLIDSLADRHVVADQEDARHGLPGGNRA